MTCPTPRAIESEVFVSSVTAAIDDRNAKKLFQLIIAQQFVLISVSDEQDADDEDAMGAITAEVDDYEVLVAFTSEPLASEFIDSMGDMFGEEDHIQGFIVDGDALLEYLPNDYGLLMNPETALTALIEPKLSQQVIATLHDA